MTVPSARAASTRHLEGPRILLLLACLGLAGCGFQPFQPPASGDAPGPGLFSGPSGQLVVRKRRGTCPMKPQMPAPQTGQGAGEPD